MSKLSSEIYTVATQISSRKWYYFYKTKIRAFDLSWVLISLLVTSLIVIPAFLPIIYLHVVALLTIGMFSLLYGIDNYQEGEKRLYIFLPVGMGLFAIILSGFLFFEVMIQ